MLLIKPCQKSGIVGSKFRSILINKKSGEYLDTALSVECRPLLF